MFNKNILNAEVQQFILHNEKVDISKLILSNSTFEKVTIKEIAEQIEAKKKCEKKLPKWYTQKNIYYPNKLNIEQSSSEITAIYKASLLNGENLIDITGGFGVDTYYFSQKNKEVVYCEMDKRLAEIATHNFCQLKASNISAFNTDGIDYLKNTLQKFTFIYADPSRRSEVKNRVFLLEDSKPNVLSNLDLFFKKSNFVLLKLAPLLDLKSTLRQLKFTKEVHVVSVHNEVKELLFLLEKNYHSEVNIKTINFTKKDIEKCSFKVDDNCFFANYSYPKNYLYEPNVAILKSGAFNQVAAKFNVDKLHKHSHLYTSNGLVENFRGRIFKIIKVLNYHKKELKKELPTNKANITVRNFPESVAQIRKKTKLKDGGENYLFFTTLVKNEKKIILCKKIE